MSKGQVSQAVPDQEQYPLHDSLLCGCRGDDVCMCGCERCIEYARRAAELGRYTVIIGKLERAGINVDDFATLIWMRIEHSIEARIESMARQELRDALRGVKLTSSVEWSSVKNP